MKKWLIVLLIPLIWSSLNAVKLGDLTDVFRPEQLEISKDELFVIEDATVFVFSLKDLTFLRKFCRQGEGPGELKVNPSISNIMVPLKDSFYVISFDKAIQFTYTGQLMKELKLPPPTNYLHPLGDNFVTTRFKINDSKQPDMVVMIANSKIEEVKTLYEQPISGKQNVIDLTIDCLNVCTYQDKLFIEESPKGFIISVYDLKGDQLYQIKRDYPNIKFTDQHKEEAMKNLQNDRVIKSMGWDNFKKVVKFTNNEFLPYIKEMSVDEDKIYIKTWKKQGDRDEYILMDLKGDGEKKVYLPVVKDTGFANQVMGRSVKFYKFYNDTYYYLYENEEDDQYEVHYVALTE